MTNDPFTEAARAEALRAWHHDPTATTTPLELAAHMAEWARTHLAAQEPTNAEVEAARQATDDHLIVTEHYRDGEIRWQGCKTCDMEIGDYAEQDRHELRAALSAARAARRDEDPR